MKKEAVFVGVKKLFRVLSLLIPLAAVILCVVFFRKCCEQGRFGAWLLVTAIVMWLSVILNEIWCERSARYLFQFSSYELFPKLLAILYVTFIFAYAIPYYFYLTDTVAWFAMFIVALFPISLTVLFAFDLNAYAFFYGAVSMIGLLAVIIFFVVTVTLFKETTFLSGGFFSAIGNFFIGLWNIILGIFDIVISLIALLIGAGFWKPSLFTYLWLAHTLNIALYTFIGSALVFLGLGALRD